MVKTLVNIMILTLAVIMVLTLVNITNCIRSQMITRCNNCCDLASASVTFSNFELTHARDSNIPEVFFCPCLEFVFILTLSSIFFISPTPETKTFLRCFFVSILYFHRHLCVCIIYFSTFMCLYHLLFGVVSLLLSTRWGRPGSKCILRKNFSEPE